MSFLKISDPAKRDSMVKEYLELKKNVWDNLLSERTEEQQLQTDLSKFYRPITETQKATTKEITEGLKPIREGIENLPQAITFPPMQPIGEASREEAPPGLGEMAFKYIYRYRPDRTLGIYMNDEGISYIGNKQVTIADNNIMVEDEVFKGTSSLWELITSSRNPDKNSYTGKDYENYSKLMIKTNALYQNNDPKSPYPKSSGGDKWNKLLRHIWFKEKEREKRLEAWRSKEHEGKGVVVIPSDPNALLERLDLLLASQEAGHTGVGNELVSICDKLKAQGVLDTKAYKKLNSLIKNDSP